MGNLNKTIEQPINQKMSNLYLKKKLSNLSNSEVRTSRLKLTLGQNVLVTRKHGPLFWVQTYWA